MSHTSTTTTILSGVWALYIVREGNNCEGPRWRSQSSWHQLIASPTLLAHNPATHMQTHSPKIHKHRQLTYKLFFAKSLKKWKRKILTLEIPLRADLSETHFPERQGMTAKV